MQVSSIPRLKRRYFVNFNNHYNLEGQHAFLSASNYHWINYDEEKIEKTQKRIIKFLIEKASGSTPPKKNNNGSMIIIVERKTPTK